MEKEKRNSIFIELSKEDSENLKKVNEKLFKGALSLRKLSIILLTEMIEQKLKG